MKALIPVSPARMAHTSYFLAEERGLNFDSVHWLAARALCRWSLATRGVVLTFCPLICTVIGTIWG